MQFILYHKIKLFKGLMASENTNEKMQIEKSIKALGTGILTQLEADYNKLLKQLELNDGQGVKANILSRLELMKEASLIPQSNSDILTDGSSQLFLEIQLNSN